MLLHLALGCLRLGHDEDLEGFDTSFELCIFSGDVLVALLEVRNVFCRFCEDSRLDSELASYYKSGTEKVRTLFSL